MPVSLRGSEQCRWAGWRQGKCLYNSAGPAASPSESRVGARCRSSAAVPAGRFHHRSDSNLMPIGFELS